MEKVFSDIGFIFLVLIFMIEVTLMTRVIPIKSCDLAVFIKKCLIISKKKKKRAKLDKKTATNDFVKI